MAARSSNAPGWMVRSPIVLLPVVESTATIRNARGFSARFSSIALRNGNQTNHSRFLRDQKPVARGIKKAGRYLGQHKLLPTKDDLGPWRRSEQETR